MWRVAARCEMGLAYGPATFSPVSPAVLVPFRHHVPHCLISHRHTVCRRESQGLMESPESVDVPV